MHLINALVVIEGVVLLLPIREAIQELDARLPPDDIVVLDLQKVGGVYLWNGGNGLPMLLVTGTDSTYFSLILGGGCYSWVRHAAGIA